MKVVNNEPLSGSDIYFHTPSPQGKDIFLYPLCIGHYFCDETYEIARGSFDSYLIMYVKRGEGYAEFCDETLNFRQGQLILINCYEAHRYGAKSKLEFYWMHFDGVSAEKYYKYLTERNGWVFTLNEQYEKEVEISFQNLLKSFSGSYILKEIQLGKYITDILTMISLSEEDLGAMEKQKKTPDTSDFACERAKAYMHQHFMNHISINEIAEYVSLSTYYFIRRFKILFGVTPHRYLMNIRLDSARFFLQTTNRSIKDIALSCGFQCENHFCIAFKKQTGMTPSAFRDSKKL